VESRAADVAANDGAAAMPVDRGRALAYPMRAAEHGRQDVVVETRRQAMVAAGAPDGPERTARVALGRILRAHGVRGEVLLETFTESPDGIAAYGPLGDETGARTFRLRVLRVTPKGVVARIEGVADRTSAEALKGVMLFVDRTVLPPPEAEEYYLADLVGLAVFDERGDRIGKVVSVQNYGAGDILEIALEDGGKTELVPFKSAFVPVVDIAAGHLVVRLEEEA
jgi:16S rRNA processing protein RimM